MPGGVALQHCVYSTIRFADFAGPDGDDEATGPSVADLARAAVDRAISLAPDPRLRVAPSAIGLTGLPSYFWLADPPPPIQAVAEIPGLRVVAEARPVEFGWDFGDGSRRTTRHTGRAWSRQAPGNISHLYETARTYRLSVAVLWQARWRVGEGPWRHLGYFSTQASRAYPVRQIVAMLVRAR